MKVTLWVDWDERYPDYTVSSIESSGVAIEVEEEEAGRWFRVMAEYDQVQERIRELKNRA